MIRYRPKRWPGPNRYGRSAGAVPVAANDRVTPSDDQIASNPESCVRVSSGVLELTPLDSEDLLQHGDLPRVIGVVLDDAVQQLIVGHPGAERPGPRVVGWFQEELVGKRR